MDIKNTYCKMEFMKSRVNNVLTDENGYPIPKKVECFKCQKEFVLRFIAFRQNYTNKNHWGYWTEKEEDQGKYICTECLRNLYKKQEHLTTVKDLKRSSLRSYISRGLV